jgi:hypothetical protein
MCYCYCCCVPCIISCRVMSVIIIPGTLDRSEVELMTATLGMGFSKAQMDHNWKLMDRDNSGEVEFDEFKLWHDVLTGKVEAQLTLTHDGKRVRQQFESKIRKPFRLRPRIPLWFVRGKGTAIYSVWSTHTTMCAIPSIECIHQWQIDSWWWFCHPIDFASHHVMSCHVMSCHVMSCHVMQERAPCKRRGRSAHHFWRMRRQAVAACRPLIESVAAAAARVWFIRSKLMGW